MSEVGKRPTSIMTSGLSIGTFESGGDKLKRVSPCEEGNSFAAAEIVAIESEGPVLPGLIVFFFLQEAGKTIVCMHVFVHVCVYVCGVKYPCRKH